MAVERETWIGRFDSFLALTGASIGLVNIWRFPYIVYHNGGSCFFIPYLICVIVLGVPMMCLEIGLGQFMSQGGITAWRICPLFKGIGYASTVINFYFIMYYPILLAWIVLYMFSSFTDKLPWIDCRNDWNTPNCYTVEEEISRNYSMRTRSSVHEFWENNVLNISEGPSEIGTVNWQTALCLLLVWVICYFCVWRGVRSTGRAVYFTATVPFVLLIILLFRAIALPGASTGIQHFMMPDCSKLLKVKTWLAAAYQVIYTFTIGHGILVAIGSYNKFKYNCYRDCIIFACVNVVTCLLALFFVFSICGFIAQKYNIPLIATATSGPYIPFLLVPDAVAHISSGPLWSVIFFFMMFLFGIDSMFFAVEGFVTAIVDLFPRLVQGKYRKEIFVLGCCAFWYLVGLRFATQGGYYLLNLFDGVVHICIFWVPFFECLAIAWIYGAHKFYRTLEWKKLSVVLFPWMLTCWYCISPVISLVISNYDLKKYEPVSYVSNYRSKMFPKWGQHLSWWMFVSFIACLPIFAVISIIKQSGNICHRIRGSMRPVLPPGRGDVAAFLPRHGIVLALPPGHDGVSTPPSDYGGSKNEDRCTLNPPQEIETGL